MNTKKLLAVLVLAILGLSTMNAQEMDHSKMKKETAKMEMDSSKMANVYTCSMHPEITSTKPGTCSICGMKLTEKEMKKMDKTKTHKK